VPAAAGGTQAAATAPTSPSCSPGAVALCRTLRSRSGVPAVRCQHGQATGPSVDSGQDGQAGIGHLSEWTVHTRPSRHHGPSADTQSDSAGRAAAKTGGQQGQRGWWLFEQRSAQSRRPVPVPGCGDATVQASRTRPCGMVRCPRQTPGSVCPDTADRNGWTLLPVGGRGRGRRAGPSRRWATTAANQGCGEPATARTPVRQ
jgi:hypothetical protein